MGANTSNLPLMPDGFEYLSITFRYGDRIRLIYGTYIDINAVRETISQHWPKGIKQEANHLGPGFEFITKGSPFCPYSSGVEDDIQCRKLANQLLQRMHHQGCKLIASSLLSRTQDLTTWIFHREQIPPANYHFACIAISKENKLQFVDFPTTMNDYIKDIVAAHWKIKESKFVAGALQLKLAGKAWNTNEDEANIKSKVLIRALIAELGAQQWILYGCSNIRGGGDTFFFRYDPTIPVDRSRVEGFSINFINQDRLRMIEAPDSVSDAVKDVVVQFWKKGIQKEKKKYGALELKLAGMPWWSTGKAMIYTRLLLCKIFEKLMSIGWRAQNAMHLTKVAKEKCMITFQRCAPQSSGVFCLALGSTDRIRIINAPPQLAEALISEVKRMWSFGVTDEGTVAESHELKLKGTPWADEHDGAHGRVLLTYLLNVCTRLGWYLMFSADVSSIVVSEDEAPDYPLEVHSWWFINMGGSSYAQQPPSAPPLL